MNGVELSLAIKEYADQVGFFRCGIATIHEVNTERFEQWLERGYHAEMDYLTKHLSVRKDPSQMLECAKSVIICAANYYPENKQSKDAPQIAYYAYGKDYHKWIKKRLVQIEKYIQSLNSTVTTRSFVDTAPIFERYWAAQAGVGFIGKSNNLIIPDAGTYFLLGGILIDLDLIPDSPLKMSCGQCNRCIEACPTQALRAPYCLDSRSCLSYRTIEHKGDWASLPFVSRSNNLYGCDACQRACPFNRFARPTDIPECSPLPFMNEIESLVSSEMSDDDFNRTFESSPIRRIRREGFERNAKNLLNHNL